MIRINLLETAKGKNKRAGGGVPTLPTMEMGDMGSPRLKVLALLVVLGLLNFGYWYRLDRQAQSIAKQMQQAEQKNRELSDVKARYMEHGVKLKPTTTSGASTLNRCIARCPVRPAPVTLLAMLGETVNGTEADLAKERWTIPVPASAWKVPL